MQEKLKNLSFGETITFEVEESLSRKITRYKKGFLIETFYTKYSFGLGVSSVFVSESDLIG